jgi:hypothetical protein
MRKKPAVCVTLDSRAQLDALDRIARRLKRSRSSLIAEGVEFVRLAYAQPRSYNSTPPAVPSQLRQAIYPTQEVHAP